MRPTFTPRHQSGQESCIDHLTIWDPRRISRQIEDTVTVPTAFLDHLGVMGTLHLPIMTTEARGVCWHRPRDLGLVGPGLLEEDARCPPTSSWWAMETSVTLARRGLGKRPSGGRGGCCSRSGRRSCSAEATTGVLVNTARFDGRESHKRERSCLELRGPGAARKHGPGGRWRQIA